MQCKVFELDIKNKIRNLDIEAKGVVSSTKHFPVFQKEGTEIIFKPLSKTKPYSTPLFAYSEVYWSYLINRFFDQSTPIYKLAICKGLTKEQPKYYEKGCIVDNILNRDEKLINLLEIFKKYPDSNIDISKYVNYCEVQYDYEKVLKSDFFRSNPELGAQLAYQILCSILRRDDNYHYENVSFIEKNGKILRIAPMIDMEFSEMFMLPDELEKHQENFSKYDIGMGPRFKYNDDLSFEDNYIIFNHKLNNGSIYDRIDDYEFYNLRKNINTITKLYPNVCKEFLKRLVNLREYIEKEEIIFDEDFLGEFSSFDWLPTRMVLKEGISKDSLEYISALNYVNNNKRKLDTKKFNERLRKEVLWSIDKLTHILKLYLNNNKGYTTGIMDYDNSTLYKQEKNKEEEAIRQKVFEKKID